MSQVVIGIREWISILEKQSQERATIYLPNQTDCQRLIGFVGPRASLKGFQGRVNESTEFSGMPFFKDIVVENPAVYVKNKLTLFGCFDLFFAKTGGERLYEMNGHRLHNKFTYHLWARRLAISGEKFCALREKLKRNMTSNPFLRPL